MKVQKALVLPANYSGIYDALNAADDVKASVVDDHKISIVAILGIVIGAILFIIALLLLIRYYRSRKAAAKSQA